MQLKKMGKITLALQNLEYILLISKPCYRPIPFTAGINPIKMFGRSSDLFRF